MISSLVECTSTSAELQYWLEYGKDALVLKDENHSGAILFRFEKESGIEYLYAVKPLIGNRVSWHDKPEFAGIHAHERGLFFTDDVLRDYMSGWAKCSNQDNRSMSAEIGRQVNQYVEDAIQNDRSNLFVDESPGWTKAADYRGYLEHGARRDAIELLFKGQKPDTQFHSSYEMGTRLDEEVFLAYLKNSDDVIKTQAEKYMARHQEQFLLQFLEMGALQQAYNELMDDSTNLAHRMKAITDAVKNSGGKTVNVTVVKCGQEMTFKTTARSLVGYRERYNGFDIQIGDRRKFEQAFGRCADYTADEIVRITYGRNTIYETAPAMDDDISQTMEQSM